MSIVMGTPQTCQETDPRRDEFEVRGLQAVNDVVKAAGLRGRSAGYIRAFSLDAARAALKENPKMTVGSAVQVAADEAMNRVEHLQVHAARKANGDNTQGSRTRGASARARRGDMSRLRRESYQTRPKLVGLDRLRQEMGQTNDAPEADSFGETVPTVLFWADEVELYLASRASDGGLVSIH